MGRNIIASQTIAQLGGNSLYGALVYIGAEHIVVGKDYISFHVNGKPGEHWTVKITLDWSDTYIVELIAIRGEKSETLVTEHDVYCDQLQSIVESMYDEAIIKHNGGVIPRVGKIERAA